MCNLIIAEQSLRRWEIYVQKSSIRKACQTARWTFTGRQEQGLGCLIAYSTRLKLMCIDGGAIPAEYGQVRLLVVERHQRHTAPGVGLREHRTDTHASNEQQSTQNDTSMTCTFKKHSCQTITIGICMRRVPTSTIGLGDYGKNRRNHARGDEGVVTDRAQRRARCARRACAPRARATCQGDAFLLAIAGDRLRGPRRGVNRVQEIPQVRSAQ